MGAEDDRVLFHTHGTPTAGRRAIDRTHHRVDPNEDASHSRCAAISRLASRKDLHLLLSSARSNLSAHSGRVSKTTSKGSNCMKRRSAIALLVAGFAALWRMRHRPQAKPDRTHAVRRQRKSSTASTKVGDANWRVEDGMIVADKGNGFASSPRPTTRITRSRAEFWVEANSNSGIFIRCTDAEQRLAPRPAYEVNVWDTRPDPSYGTGAIVNVAKVNPMPHAGGKWNTFEITAKGPSCFTVVLNGQKTVDGAQDAEAREKRKGRSPARSRHQGRQRRAERQGRGQIPQG